MNRLCGAWTLGAVLAIGGVTLMGQGSTNAERPSVSGIVINQFTGAPIAGVRVTLKPEAGSGVTAVTDQSGQFAIGKLPSGRYSVSAARDGFFRARHSSGPQEISVGAANAEGLHLEMIEYATGWIPTRTFDGQPDIEGFWYSDTVTPMNRPSEFANKEFFTEQEAAEYERRAALRTYDDRGTTPVDDLSNNDGNQFWYEKPPTLDSRRTSLIVDPPNGATPGLSREAQQQANAFLAARERAERAESRDRGERCLGLTVVRRLVQIVQAPGYVVMLREAFANLSSHADIIPLNVRRSLPPEMRQWNGDRRGRWEGDTLVVETTNLKDEAGYDARRLPSGNPRVIERYTRLGPDTILWEVTTESSSFTRPFTYQMQLKKTTGPLYESACHEGNYSLANILAGARAAEKTGATIAGRVLNEAGQPIPNAAVRLVGVDYHRDGYPVLQDASSISFATANQRGEYQISPVPAGKYYVTATGPAVPGTTPVRTFHPGETALAAATPLVVREGETLRDIDVKIRALKGFRIRGEVTSTVPRGEGAAPQRVPLGIVARDTDLAEDTYRFVGFAELDPATGKFETQEVAPGTYDLYATVQDFRNWLGGGAASAVGRVPIEVRDRDLEGISVRVDPSVEVIGSVSFSSGVPDRNSLRVTLKADGSSAKYFFYGEVAGRPVTVTSDGSFSIPGVPEGRFHVMIAGLSADNYVADIRRGNSSVYDSGFEVAAVSREPIQVIVKSDAGSIKGVVRDAGGKPMANATVALAPARSRRQNPALYADTTSDSGGNFSITGVAPGDYKLFAWERAVWIGARQNPAFIAKYEDRGRPVTVVERATVVAEITAVPAEER